MHIGLGFRQAVWVLALSAIGSLLAFSSQAADNPLIGSWKWDNDKTLREFRLPTDGSEQLKSDAARAKRFVEATVKKAGSNMTLTYTDKKYTEVIVASNGMALSKVTSPYRIVEVGKDYVIIDQLEHGGVNKAFLDGNSFYVEVKVGEFTFKDYFTRM
jgi:hypothetical protein